MKMYKSCEQDKSKAGLWETEPTEVKSLTEVMDKLKITRCN